MYVDWSRFWKCHSDLDVKNNMVRSVLKLSEQWPELISAPTFPQEVSSGLGANGSYVTAKHIASVDI